MLGNKPICTKIPSNSSVCSSPLFLSWYLRPVTRPSPRTSVVWAFLITVTFGKEVRRSCKTLSAFKFAFLSSKVTCLTIPAKSIAASTPELPPPTTATSLFSNKGPSQCGQNATPLLINASSPVPLIYANAHPLK